MTARRRTRPTALQVVSGLSDGTNVSRSPDDEYYLCDRNSTPAMEYGPLTLEDLSDLATLLTEAVAAETPDAEDGAS